MARCWLRHGIPAAAQPGTARQHNPVMFPAISLQLHFACKALILYAFHASFLGRLCRSDQIGHWRAGQ